MHRECKESSRNAPVWAISGPRSYFVHILFVYSSIFNKSLDMIDLYNQIIENNKDVSRYWFTNNFFITCQVRNVPGILPFMGAFLCDKESGDIPYR
jgi:hypothetical protein